MVAAIVSCLLSSGCGAAANSAKTTSTTTSTTTTTTAAPAVAAEVPTGPVAPLTGLATTADQAPLLGRPALAVKIDNSRQAMPQAGLSAADIVFEIKVEGISRLMAVFHSHNAKVVGPTRSARYSDPDILALLGKPLFGWSGANDGVSSAVARSPWIVNVNWDRVGAKEYYRRSDRHAPHNLYTSTDSLFRHARPSQPAARPVFEYLAPSQENTAPAVAVPGISMTVGDTPSSWVWDAAGSRWLRWQYGIRHRDETTGQVAATNVVILDTRYGGGSATPTALTTGSGRATVLTGGSLIVGKWQRPKSAAPYSLVGPDGQPIRLRPGTTWIELTPGATSHAMTAETASGLLSSGR